jgi:hypothetical protein
LLNETRTSWFGPATPIEADNPKSVVALGLIEHMSGMNVVEPFDSHSVLFDIVPGHPGQYVDAMFAPLAQIFF